MAWTAAAETTGLPQCAQSGSGSVSCRPDMQTRQKGMALAVSRICSQIRHGAGSKSEASASRMLRAWDRTDSLRLGTPVQAYRGRHTSGSEKWHDSCQSFILRKLEPASNLRLRGFL